MPRHPPNALLTLDHSHCQCPSYLVWLSLSFSLALEGQTKPYPAHHQSGKHRTARIFARIKAIQKTRATFYSPAHIRCHRRVRTLPFRQTRRRSSGIGSLRPASRDLSGDARSGNANRTVPVKDRSPNQNNPFRQDFLSTSAPSSNLKPARQSKGFNRVRART